jgi:hypothetical protein
VLLFKAGSHVRGDEEQLVRARWACPRDWAAPIPRTGSGALSQELYRLTEMISARSLCTQIKRD